jgi:hypothetical protein
MKRAGLAIVIAGLAATATAQEYGYDHGRIRYAEQGVTLQRANDPGAEEATQNAPFFPGDRVWTDGGGRAEFQFPDGSVLRLDSRSKLDYVAHEDGSGDETILLRLWSGSLFLHVRDRGRSPRFEVEVPGGLVSVSRSGAYRVDAESQETRLSVYEGEAVLDAGERRTVVEEGEAMFVRHGEWPDEPQTFDRDQLDEFAFWDREREDLDRYRGGSQSARYLPREVAPYASEFDAYGNWHYETEVGYVWAPTVQVGWRPYWNGRWCWTAYGWTWVPAEPWGYAPSHYGRWGFSAGLGWYWAPGRTWGPAWVSWAIGRDHVGWCPLGYRDRPVWGLDRAVPRGHGSLAGRQGPGWTFARRGDMGARDLARRRLDAGAVEVTSMRVADTPRARPSRDLRTIDTPRAVPRAGQEALRPRDGAAERRADRANTIPWPGAVRRDREGERRAHEGREGASERRRELGNAPARPSDSPRAAERPTARPRAREESPSSARRAPAERPTSAEGRTPSGRARPEARTPSEERRDTGGAPAREGARPRDRQPDRDVMRQLFQPLAEPRSQAPRGGGETARPRGGERPETRDGSATRGGGSSPRGGGGGETRAQPPRSRPEPRGESRPPSSSQPKGGGGSAEQRKPPRP